MYISQHFDFNFKIKICLYKNVDESIENIVVPHVLDENKMRLSARTFRRK